jgi:hypothetical protein
MRYQQTPKSRLSKASSWLQADGQWHAFSAEPGMHYRVSGSIVQKVLIEEHEHASLLRLFDAVPPLPKRLFREGFREELRLLVEGDHYVLTDILIRAYMGWDLLAQAAESFAVRMSYTGGNTLHCSIAFHSWSPDSLIRTLIFLRAFTAVAAQLSQDAIQGIPHTVAEVLGLLRSANDVYTEQFYPAPRSGGRGGSVIEQEELF